MDNPKFNLVSICSGVGGLDRGVSGALRSLGITPRTICYVEREAFACAVLDSRMEAGDLDAAPIWANISDFPVRCFAGCTDMVIGGIPCQDFSLAGKRAGTIGERWLWPDFWRIVKESKADFLFIENVPGFISGGGLAYVLSDLAKGGWYAQWDCFSAAEVGAPHKRERFFLLAYSSDCDRRGKFQSGKPASNGRRELTGSREKDVADAIGLGHEKPWESGFGGSTEKNHERKTAHAFADGLVSGVMADADGERRHGRNQGNTSGNQREIQATGLCGAMGDTGCAGLEGRELGETCDRNRYGTETYGSASESGEIPVWPPCPEDREAWARVAAVRSDLVPAIGGKLNPRFVNWLMGFPSGWTEIPGAARIDMLRCLGNAVVSATAELAFRTLWAR